MVRVDSYEAAISDIYKAKALVESALKRLTVAEPLGKTARVLNPRRQLLDMLPNISTELSKCEDAYASMLDGAIIEGDRESGFK